MSTEIIGYFNTTSQGETGNLRTSNGGDHLLGNAILTRFRNLVVLFDPADYQALASDPNLMLTSAELVAVENFSVDAFGTAGVTADIFAYFSNEANGGINPSTPNFNNQGANAGAGGFFGNTGARRGPFDGLPGGADNTNPFYTNGVSPTSTHFCDRRSLARPNWLSGC